MAGDIPTLTCTVNSEFPANLKWVRIINEVQVELENTPNITVSKQIVSNKITKRNITFKPLLTSHAGKYKCVSVLNNYGPKLLSTKELEYAVIVQSKYCYDYITHHFAYNIDIIIMLYLYKQFLHLLFN